MRDIKLTSQSLGADQCHQNRISIHTPHEDTNDLAILVPLGTILRGWQGEPFPDRGLDRRTSRRDQVAQLVGRTHREGANSTRRQLHQVDGDDTPCALHAELFKEGGGHDVVVRDKGVGVEERAANNANEDDGEAATEDLTGPAAGGTTSQGAEVSDDLGDGDGIGGEVELILKHGWVEILGAVGLGFG